MKVRSHISRNLWGLWILSTMLMGAPAALALQEEVPTEAVAAIGVVALLFGLVIGLGVYVYFALALQTIAKKTNTENPWLAWIPIVNIILWLNVAKKPIWWIILCLIPFVNIIIFIIVWMAIAEARGKPSWWGILMIVPFVNFIVPGYLAWSD